MPVEARAQWRKLYKTKRWQQLREAQLARHPLCMCAHHQGKDLSAEATVVDHITPHRGDRKLFFDRRNLQSLMASCHNRHKQSAEKGGAGFNKGCGPDGQPLSGEHPWYD